MTETLGANAGGGESVGRNRYVLLTRQELEFTVGCLASWGLGLWVPDAAPVHTMAPTVPFRRRTGIGMGLH